MFNVGRSMFDVHLLKQLNTFERKPRHYDYSPVGQVAPQALPDIAGRYWMIIMSGISLALPP